MTVRTDFVVPRTDLVAVNELFYSSFSALVYWFDETTALTFSGSLRDAAA